MHWFEPINKKLWDRSGWKHLLNTARKISSNHSSYQTMSTRGPVWMRQGKERDSRPRSCPGGILHSCWPEQGSGRTRSGLSGRHRHHPPLPSLHSPGTQALWRGVGLPRCTEEATGGWAVEPGSLLLQWMVNTYWNWERPSRTTRTAGGNAALQQGSCWQNAHQCSWGMADRNKCYKKSFQNLPGVGNLFCSLLCNAYTIHCHS